MVEVTPRYQPMPRRVAAPFEQAVIKSRFDHRDCVVLRKDCSLDEFNKSAKGGEFPNGSTWHMGIAWGPEGSEANPPSRGQIEWAVQQEIKDAAAIRMEAMGIGKGATPQELSQAASQFINTDERQAS
jgi:hypothetical protein